MEQLKLEVRDFNAQNQLLTATKEAGITELKTTVAAYEDQIEINDKIMENQREEFETKQESDRKKFETEIARLEGEISQSVTGTNALKHKISTLEGETSRKTATVERKESELKAKTRALEEKEAIISGMREQLTKAREHLTSKQQVSCE